MSDNTSFLLIIVVMLVCMTSCLMDPSSIVVSLDGDNKSDSDVWFSYEIPNYSNPSSEIKHFHDNTANADAVLYYRTEFLFSKRKTTSTIFAALTKGGWEWLKRKIYPNNLHIQVWSDELIQQVGWEEFVKNIGTKYKYELEYVLDIDDLDKIGYRVTYPPSGVIEQMCIVYPE